MTRKYGGYTAAELREFIAHCEKTGENLDAIAHDDDTSMTVIRDLLDTLSTPAEATTEAWMTEDGERVISDVTKQSMPRAVQEPYTVALGRVGRNAEAMQAGAVPEGWRSVPVERSYDMRAKAIIAFNKAEQSGKDRDDALDAAWRAMLAAAPQAPVADAARAEQAELKRIGYATLHGETIISVRLDDSTPTDFIDGYSGRDVFVIVAPTQQPARTSEAGEAVAWVRVADRLPPKNETVIVTREFDGPGDWRKKAGGLLDDGVWQVFGASWTPTHWAPMPASPDAAPAQQAVTLTDAARDVLAERRRQVETEGWTPELDDAEHPHGELALAASAYADYATRPAARRLGVRPMIWPWDASWWKPTTPRRDLVKAGALILAEIERIDRAALQSHSEGGTR